METTTRRESPGAITSPPGFGTLFLLAALLGGCGDDVPTVPEAARLDGLEFTGGVNVAESFPVQLEFFLDVRNTADRELELMSDGCGVLPRAHASPSRTEPPLWDARPGEPCHASVAPVSIPPGENRRFQRRYSARDVLGDSLPDGRYFFTVTYRASLASSDDTRLVEVRAGEADLAVPREGMSARAREPGVPVRGFTQ